MDSTMPVPVGLHVWSRLVTDLTPYLGQVAGAFGSLWFPDHVQFDYHPIAER
jgi:hypothetical protein